MKIMFVLLPLVALAAFLDLHASPFRDANVEQGFPYPIAGAPHVLVLLAVGLIAARYPGPRRWLPPILFVLFFAAGLSAGMQNPAFLEQPVEVAVLLSVAITGGLALSGRRPPLRFLAPLLAALALVHGFAHGMQVSSSGNAMRVSREIVTAAAILLVAGLAAGVVLRFFTNRAPAPPSLAPRETPGSAA